MVYIGSVGLGIPNYHMKQTEVKELVKQIFKSNGERFNRLLPIFENAKINERQFSVHSNWFMEYHTFANRNELYCSLAKKHSLDAIDHCLANDIFLKEPIPYEGIDMIVFVSSTGISTPSIDAYLFNERPFKESVVRMPMWGLGCAGGAIGLSRAFDWALLHKNKTVLVICCELCSLTFQKDDKSTSNIVGTALFGDGVGATLLIGSESKYASYIKGNKLSIKQSSSFTEKKSTSVMGWNVTDNGFEVIFSKRIPKLVKTLWKEHMGQFLDNVQMSITDISSMVAHPGGRKVLEEMENCIDAPKGMFANSYDVLKNHGNMSSATVMYVLKKWLKEGVRQQFEGQKGILCALGPGFSSEILLLEWVGA